MTEDTMTRPERCAARAQGRDIAHRITEAGGCAFCKHRARLLEAIGTRAACGLDPPMTFPECLDDTFDIDETRLQDRPAADPAR
jgi:hypothetical protein